MHPFTPAVSRHSDLRTMLIDAGAGQYIAQMSVPYMFFAPSACDPYAQGVIQIVQGLQRMLNAHGAPHQGVPLVVDGALGHETAEELIMFAGPRWYDKNWAQLYADVRSGALWPGWKRLERGAILDARQYIGAGAAFDAYDELGAEAVDPRGNELWWQSPLGLGAIVVGGLVVYRMTQKKGRRARHRRHG